MLVIETLFVGIVIFSSGNLVKSQDAFEEACHSWANLKETAENFSDVKLICKVNDYCTGVSCDGKYENYKGKLEVRLQHCSSPVSVEVYLSVPKLNIQEWRQTFFHGDRVPLPRTNSDAHNNEETNFIEVFLAQTKEISEVTFGVSIISNSLLGHSGNPVSVVLLKNETVKLPPCPYRKWNPSISLKKGAVVGETHAVAVLPIAPSKTFRSGPAIRAFNDENEAKVGDVKTCNLGILTSCDGPGEICEVKFSSMTVGVCNCLPNYYRNASGVCESNPLVPSTTAAPNPVTPPSDSNRIQSPTQTALSIAVPIVIILVLSALVILAYKYRWIVRLRARLMPSRRYEEMVIDGDEVGNIQSSGSDPIA